MPSAPAVRSSRFLSVSFGTGKVFSYFPHIAVDFDLKTAMRTGLVKSLVLDKRSETE